MLSPRLLFPAVLVVIASTAVAAPWEDQTAETIGVTGEWSNKVELADIDDDGDVDILFSNGGNYRSAGTPVPNRVFLNDGAGGFTEATSMVLGDTFDLTRVIKARDLDGDGNTDIIVGNTYSTQSRLFLGAGAGVYNEVTATNLPQVNASIGDLEIGDVDGDGDLDIILADWGAGDPQTNGGGVVQLWLGDGTGAFTDATVANMPITLVRWSWELELVDVDNDYDLDAVISCKSCTGSKLYRNDGAGVFTDDSGEMPQFTNNYEFEAMDINDDGFLDLVTINDGPGLRSHIFTGNGTGFADATAGLWSNTHNFSADDNMVAFLDYDSDGDPDFLMGSLTAPDRVLINNNGGNFTALSNVFDGDATPGTLGIAVADLNGDGKLDVVQAQGEGTDPDVVHFGVDIAADTAEPIISHVEEHTELPSGAPLRVRARVHDHKSPNMPFDFQLVIVRWSADGGAETDVPMQWYGENLYRADIDATPDDYLVYEVCAVDAAGNAACSEPIMVGEIPAEPDDAGVTPSPDAGGPGPMPPGDDSGCGCDSAGGAGGLLWPTLLVLLAFGFRRRERERL